MEPITHLAAGLLTAQALRPVLVPRLMFASAQRSGRGFMALCAVAATMPDIDILAGFFGPESYLLHHRGLTHSAFVLPLLALLLAWGARRLGAQIPLRQGFLAASAALATHLFLDIMTAFGTQLYAPFSHARVSFEGLFIVDPAFTLALLGFALAARLRPPRAQTLALWGLALMLAYPLLGNALRSNTQSRYEALLTSRGETFDRVSLAPDALAPYYWKVLVSSGPTLRVTTATPFDLGKAYPVLHFLRVDRAELLRLGNEASIFRTYAWFAEYPAEYPAEIQPPQAGSRTPGLHLRRFVDAIFVNASPVLNAVFDQNPGFAECAALLNSAGQLVAWRDWHGVTHPVPDTSGSMAEARAAQATRDQTMPGHASQGKTTPHPVI